MGSTGVNAAWFGRAEVSHQAVGDLGEVVVSLSHVILVGRQVRVDEHAGGGPDAERYPDAALVPQSRAWGAETEARRDGGGAHVAQQGNDPSVREDGVVGGLLSARAPGGCSRKEREQERCTSGAKGEIAP